MRSMSSGGGTPAPWLAVRPMSPRGVGQFASAGDQVTAPASYVYTFESASAAPAATSVAPSPSNSSSEGARPARPGFGNALTESATSSNATSPPLWKYATQGPCPASSGPTTSGPSAGAKVARGQPGCRVNGKPVEVNTAIPFGLTVGTMISSLPSLSRSARTGSCAGEPPSGTLHHVEPSAA